MDQLKGMLIRYMPDTTHCFQLEENSPGADKKQIETTWLYKTVTVSTEASEMCSLVSHVSKDCPYHSNRIVANNE